MAWMITLLSITIAIIFEIFFPNAKSVLNQMPSTFFGGGNTTIPINKATIMQNLNIFQPLFVLHASSWNMR